MKAIIFGSNGQDGHYLRALLQSKNIDVIGISRRSADIIGDVGDKDFVFGLIQSSKPEYVFHLAADSTTNHEAIFRNHHAISTGSLNILEAVRISAPSARVFLSGSAMQFMNSGIPINENTSFEASSPYSVARIHSVFAGRYFRDHLGLKVYVGYFFNHDSPLRSERHVNQKIIQAVKRIQKGSQEKLVLGNLSVKKEFSFAGDVVKAVWQLVNQETVFETVIGSGLAYSIENWTDYCFTKAGLTWQDYVSIEDKFIPQYEILVSDPALIKSIGWSPSVGFEQLADMMWSDSHS